MNSPERKSVRCSWYQKTVRHCEVKQQIVVRCESIEGTLEGKFVQGAMSEKNAQLEK